MHISPPPGFQVLFFPCPFLSHVPSRSLHLVAVQSLGRCQRWDWDRSVMGWPRAPSSGCLQHCRVPKVASGTRMTEPCLLHSHSRAVGYLPSAINMDHINFAALSVPSLVPHILLPVCSSQFSSLSVHLFPAFASVHGSMALQPPQSLFVRQTGFFPPYKSSLSWIALALAGFVLHSLDVSSSYPRG